VGEEGSRSSGLANCFSVTDCSLTYCSSVQVDRTPSCCVRNVSDYIVAYRGFYSRWNRTPGTLFSKHTSGVYTQRCPTQDAFYRASSGNLPTRSLVLAARNSPNTGMRPASTLSGHKLTFLQSGSFQAHQDNPSPTVTTHVLFSQAPDTN
jgi:hypothetical protein